MSSIESIVRDPSLAPRGRMKMDWARAHMPVLNRIGSNWRIKSL